MLDTKTGWLRQIIDQKRRELEITEALLEILEAELGAAILDEVISKVTSPQRRGTIMDAIMDYVQSQHYWRVKCFGTPLRLHPWSMREFDGLSHSSGLPQECTNS